MDEDEQIEIPIVPISARRLAKYEEFLSQQIIRVPSDELLEIYERRVLTELSFLKAEKFDSPEHHEELTTYLQENQTDKIPRNIQNPNFDRLMKFYHQITFEDEEKGIQPLTPQQTLPIIVEMAEFLIDEVGILEPFDYDPAINEPQIDVRCCDTMPLYFNYLLTKQHLRTSPKT